jgi:EpsI family protein
VTAMRHRILALGGVLLAAIVIMHAAEPNEQLPPRERLSTLPASLATWRAAGDVAIDEESLKVLNADDYVNRSYVSGGRDVELFVAYYGSQRQGGTMHSPLNCLPATGWQPMSTGELPIDARPAPVTANRVVIQKGLDRQLVIYWYQSHGRTLASEYASKAYLVLDSIRLHRSDAALVRVVTASDAEPAAIDFIRTLRPVLQRFLPD